MLAAEFWCDNSPGLRINGSNTKGDESSAEDGVALLSTLGWDFDGVGSDALPYSSPGCGTRSCSGEVVAAITLSCEPTRFFKVSATNGLENDIRVPAVGRSLGRDGLLK